MQIEARLALTPEEVVDIDRGEEGGCGAGVGLDERRRVSGAGYRVEGRGGGSPRLSSIVRVGCGGAESAHRNQSFKHRSPPQAEDTKRSVPTSASR